MTQWKFPAGALFAVPLRERSGFIRESLAGPGLLSVFTVKLKDQC